MEPKCRLWLAALFALATSSSGVSALQVIEGRDGVTAEAQVSIKEPTRIRVDGGSITEVFGNIYSSSSCGQSGASAPPTTPGMTGATSVAQINPTGEIVVECDRDKGEVYVRPVGAGGKPINLFVSTDGGTYTLLLRRVDMPADTIVIQDRSPKATKATKSNAELSLARSPAHIRGIKSMLISMATDRVPNDVRVEEVRRPIKLWVEANFTLMRTYEGRGLIGEKYLLTNVSDKAMVLAEQEFDRDEGEVVAVSVENHNLLPGQSTNVYVIRLGS